jgi:spermidine synthase
MLVCLGYCLVWRRRAVAAALAVAAAGVTLAVWGVRRDRLSAPSVVELFRGNSHFGMLQVLDVKGASRRYFLNDYLSQNIYDPDLKQSATLFSHVFNALANAYTTNIQDVLCIGLGVGFVPMDFAGRGANVDVVEINPAVIPVAVRYFDFYPDKVHVFLGDGRCHLNQCTNRYDVVILDAFLGDSMPWHLMTREAFSAMRRALRPGGTLLVNSFGGLDAKGDFLAASLAKTLQAVFRQVRVHSCGSGEMFFVAADRADLVMARPPDLSSVHPSLRDSVERTCAGLVQTQPGHGRVLTDDYNPVDFFDAGNREALRRTLALSIKNL